MQYEIYLDVFFLVNFSMDYLILLAVKRALKCTATHGYVLLGAFAGAFSVSVLMCIPMYPAVKILILHLLVNSCMLIVSLRPACVSEFIREWILLYIVSFLMGGIMTWVRPYMGEFFREGVLCFSITVCSYYLLCRVMDFLEMMWKFQGSRCKVTLYFRERVCTFRAVIDSGNSLCDTLSCKPVHIIDKKATGAAKKYAVKSPMPRNRQRGHRAYIIKSATFGRSSAICSCERRMRFSPSSPFFMSVIASRYRKRIVASSCILSFITDSADLSAVSK